MAKKFYGIEKRSTYYGTEYRFYSFYNGMRGAWCGSLKSAKAGGEKHQGIIWRLHGHSLEAESEAESEVDDGKCC